MLLPLNDDTKLMHFRISSCLLSSRLVPLKDIRYTTGEPNDNWLAVRFNC
jgi:hypothetical protein